MDRLLTAVIGAIALVLVVAAHVLVRRSIARAVRREEARQDPRMAAQGSRPWLALTVRPLAAPVLLLLWLQGAYVTARIMLPAIAAGASLDVWNSALRWGYGLAFVVGLAWLLARAGRAFEAFLVWQASRTGAAWDDLLLPLAGKVARYTLPLLALILGAPALGVAPALQEIVRNATSLVLIGVVAFVLVQVVNTATALMLRQYRVDVRENLEARAVHTQVIVLKKVAITVIAVFTLASMLMVFESVRQFGASILASAGIAGIIVGLAAQRSIATLLAGFQIALTQPIRVDDVVIVENEWGRIEDITLTYVVVRIWDLRRLVVPISYFIERPFQNWTRASADLLATVFLYVDYSAPIDRLRDELTRILTSSPLWDRKVNVLQVTEAREHCLEVRALASAADASQAWDLRCEVREKLILFLQAHHPTALARTRVSMTAGPGEATTGPRPAVI